MTSTKISVVLLMIICGPASHSLARGFLSLSSFHRCSSLLSSRGIICRRGGGPRDHHQQQQKATVLQVTTTSSSSTSSTTENDKENVTSALTPSTFGGIAYTSTSEGSPNSKLKHRVIFVLGGPGAGKGTQSAKIIQHYKSSHYSVGELLRRHGPHSIHADLIAHSLVSGQIVPVEISLELLKNAMDASNTSHDTQNTDGGTTTTDDGDDDRESHYGARFSLVDGFPRNFDNWDGWCRVMLQPHDTRCLTLAALVFECPENVLIQRILERGRTSGRSDDNVASAKKRFKTFETETKPVVATLEEAGVRVRRISGESAEDVVWREVQAVMDEFVKDDVLTRNRYLIDVINQQDWDAYRDICPHFEDANADTVEESLIADNEGALVTNESNAGSVVQNAKIDIVTGTEAIVEYDRIFKNQEGDVSAAIREKRVWHHGDNGW
eukprot:CAMPEP_0172498316 /NCGR_PEP_ID=MMETSP1066-20121228/112107_1 /TAXON_ID=671091 /ORGANISM="Coscinodiscus wailesii, Strain CCMP2513" /LENGTH=438 /DNA_ID=CAMNT_0013271543 /DNA_START=73 /DNA_END=1386 /DNA_ORIENTATION=+